MGKGGLNCCVPRCTNYYEKTKDDKVSYIGFPKQGNGNDEWRAKLIAAVSRSRSDKFNPDTAKICSVHFEPKCLIFHGKGYTLVKDSLPTINMPKKSIEKTPTAPRKLPFPRQPPPVPMRVAFLTFPDLIKESKKLTTPWVVVLSTTDTLVLGKINTNCDIEVKVRFDGSFRPTVTYRGFLVQRDYDVEVNGLLALCKELQAINWCPGSEPRSKTCSVAVDEAGFCKSCAAAVVTMKERAARPLSAKAPLSSASRPALIQEVRSVRSQLKGHDAELLKVKRRLETETVPVSEDVKEGLGEVLTATDIQDPFLSLFWEEQKKAGTRDPRGMRWHPMMIRFAIYLHYQSPRAYEALRNTGVLHLPNKSTLRDYTSFFKPQEGFQAHVFKNIKKFVDHLPPEKRYAAVLHDEMTVRGDLVYNRRGGEIIGFVNPDSWSFKKDSDSTLATHVLVFMAVGVNNNLKQSLGYFATTTATADVLFPLLWEAVANLEQQGVKVISSTSDKASPNQKLYRMHGHGIVHETPNMYASDNNRPMFFISDPPHLIKTLGNNLERSRPDGTKYLWKDNKHLLWSHIYQLYLNDQQGLLRRSKLRDEHVRLTPSSRMSVRLAAQVLSQSVGRLLQEHYPVASETAKFILMCDEFFDCLNSRSFTEHIKKRKPAMAPYREIEDPRFQFLEDFLAYLATWKDNVAAREGFSQKQKDRMFLSQQTFEGVTTTVKGFTGATKYLLSHGVPYVFSNNFCQDPLEEHFGRHRGLGMRSKNPSVYEFGHHENKLEMQRTLAFQFQPKGNVAGRPRHREEIQVDEQPLPKIRRH